MTNRLLFLYNKSGMEIIVKINEVNDIDILDNADSYLLANKNFSLRYQHSFTLNEIKKIKKTGKKVYALVNKIFKDKDLESLKKYLTSLKNIGTDGIFFTDFAVFMLCDELGMKDRCYFYHETFLRNSKDIETYQDLGISNIIISKDMNLNNIKHLNKEKKDTYGILCFGYVPIYESVRKAITNYAKQQNLDKTLTDSFALELKEETRPDISYRIIEQNGWTSIFNDKVLCYIDSFNELKENVGMFVFDSLFFEAAYMKEVIELFKNGKTLEDIKKLDESILLSDMFLNKKVGLI